MLCHLIFESPHDKTNKMICAPSEDSDQPRHPPSLIRVFAVHMKKAWVLSYPLRSYWANAQADLSLRWAHMPFCWFCHEAAHFSLECSRALPAAWALRVDTTDRKYTDDNAAFRNIADVGKICR